MVDQQKKTQDEKIAEGFNNPNNQAPTSLVRSAGTVPQVGGQSPVSGPKPASSGQFTNVRNFLGANVGAGERLASKTAEGVQRGVGQATQQVGQFGQKIGQAVGQEEQRVSQADQVRAGIEAITKPQQTQQQEGATVPNPFALVEDGTQFDQARQLITGQTKVADITQQKQQLGAQAQSGLTQAGQQVGQLGSESGRFNLLRRAVGGPMYSRGMSGLDNLLLSTEGGATLAQAQRQAGAELGQAGSQLGTQIDQFGNRLTSVDEQARNISKELQDQLTSGITGLESTFEERLKQQQATNAEERRLLETLVKNPSALSIVERDQASKLLERTGLSLGQQTFGANLNITGDTTLNRSQVISQEEAARLNALSKLMQGELQNEARGGDQFTRTQLDNNIGKSNFANEFENMRYTTPSGRKENLGDVYSAYMNPGQEVNLRVDQYGTTQTVPIRYNPSTGGLDIKGADGIWRADVSGWNDRLRLVQNELDNLGYYNRLGEGSSYKKQTVHGSFERVQPTSISIPTNKG